MALPVPARPLGSARGAPAGGGPRPGRPPAPRRVRTAISRRLVRALASPVLGF